MPNIITRPCRVCGTTMRVESLQHKVCSEVCAAELRQREACPETARPGSHSFWSPSKLAMSTHTRMLNRRPK